MPKRRQSYQDFLDTILLEMAANHPGLTGGEESRLKQALLDIMADENGWQNDPDGMVIRFDTAMQVLRSFRRDDRSILS